MSDLKHQTLEELQTTKKDCQKYITTLRSKISGQKEKLKWIDHYINKHLTETDDKKLIKEVIQAVKLDVQLNGQQSSRDIIQKYGINRLYQVKNLSNQDLKSLLKDLRQNNNEIN